MKENGGPGAARNYGAERATGDYFIVLDSDVVLPPGYIAAIDEALKSREAAMPLAARTARTPTSRRCRRPSAMP